MTAKSALVRTLGLAVVLASAARADEVNLSHLVVTVDTPLVIRGVDYAPVVEFCGDSDGCQIVVTLARGTAAVTMTARLFVNFGAANQWFTSESAGAYFVDDNETISTGLTLTSGPNSCTLTDGDELAAGLDDSQGFLVGAGGGLANPASCTFTFSD